jgi:hypothetical protein
MSPEDIQLLTHIDLGKVTWWGCGKHVGTIMDSIPAEEQCECAPKVEKDGKEYPPMGEKANDGQSVLPAAV